MNRSARAAGRFRPQRVRLSEARAEDGRRRSPHQLAHGIAREQEEMYLRARRENRRQGEVGLRLVKIALTGGIVLNQRVTYW